MASEYRTREQALREVSSRFANRVEAREYLETISVVSGAAGIGNKRVTYQLEAVGRLAELYGNSSEVLRTIAQVYKESSTHSRNTLKISRSEAFDFEPIDRVLKDVNARMKRSKNKSPPKIENIEKIVRQRLILDRPAPAYIGRMGRLKGAVAGSRLTPRQFKSGPKTC